MNTIWENSSTAEIPRPPKNELVFGNDVLEIQGIQNLSTMVLLTDLLYSEVHHGPRPAMWFEGSGLLQKGHSKK